MAGGSFRQRLAERWVDWPVLRLLVLTPGLLVVCIGLGLLGLGLALALPRLWVTSPPGVTPIVRISLVDLTQAAALRRSAERLAAAGHARDAAQAWRGAIANNPGDPELLRGALRHLVRSEPPSKRLAAEALVNAGWLLRLGATNRADVELAARAFDRLGFTDSVIRLLRPYAQGLTVAEEGVFLKALFAEGFWDEFGERWAAAPEATRGQPDLELYRAAHLVGWGPPETMGEGRRILAAAQEDASRAVAATRIELRLCAKAVDGVGYRQALGRLGERGADGLLDHLIYWKLLIRSGQKAQARVMADQSVQAPETAFELMSLAEACLALDLPDRARQLLGKYVPEFGLPGAFLAPRLWGHYTELLIDGRHWDELQAGALKLRLLDRGRSTLAGFSHYMSGCAEYGLSHFEQAREHFAKAVQESFPEPGLALEVAVRLLRMEYADLALPLLAQLEAPLGTNAFYWQALFEAHYALRQEPLSLFKAAARARQLMPQNPVFEHNYAAALIINLREPDEAMRLTRAVLERNPGLAAAKINGALALALGQRHAEAAELLGQVVSGELSEAEQTACAFGWFEIHRAAGRWAEAWAAVERIDERWLFPNQARWVAERRARLPARAGGDGG